MRWLNALDDRVLPTGSRERAWAGMFAGVQAMFGAVLVGSAYAISFALISGHGGTAWVARVLLTVVLSVMLFIGFVAVTLPLRRRGVRAGRPADVSPPTGRPERHHDEVEQLPWWYAGPALLVLIFFCVALAILGMLRSTLSLPVLIVAEVGFWSIAGYLAVYGVRLWRRGWRPDGASPRARRRR